MKAKNINGGPLNAKIESNFIVLGINMGVVAKKTMH